MKNYVRLEIRRVLCCRPVQNSELITWKSSIIKEGRNYLPEFHGLWQYLVIYYVKNINKIKNDFPRKHLSHITSKSHNIVFREKSERHQFCRLSSNFLLEFSRLWKAQILRNILRICRDSAGPTVNSLSLKRTPLGP